MHLLIQSKLNKSADYSIAFVSANDTIVSVETIVSDSDIVDGMKKVKTVPIHARLSESDVAALDKAASEQPIPVSRSMMVALIVREWLQRQQSPKKKR